MEQEPEGPPAACSVMASEPSPSFICVTAKSPGASAQLVLPESSTVLQFKEELARHLGCQASQLVLVFFGRILKDQHTLRQSGVRDGMTVHLLVRPLKRDPEDLPAAALPSAAAAMLPEGDVAGSPPLPEAEPPSAEWQLLPTSERIVQKVRQVILANPEVQQLAQQIPAISHILNNMDIMRVILDKMREIMDLARNPEVLQDLKNQEDPALVGLKSSIPGGDNPLRQLTAEMPEPALNAVQDLFVASPFAAMGRPPCCPEVQQQASGLRLGQGPGSTEARGRPDSLPVSRSCTSICSNGSCSEEGGAFATLANPLGHRGSPMSNPGPSAGTGRFSVGGGAPNPDAAAAAAAIPTLIVTLCNAYTKRMMFSLMQDALLASEGTPAAQQILHFAQQMQSPDMMAAMSNPKAIQAWVQMEQGLQTLAAEAPVLIPWFTLRLQGLLGSSTRAPPGLSDASCPESAAVSE